VDSIGVSSMQEGRTFRTCMKQLVKRVSYLLFLENMQDSSVSQLPKTIGKTSVLLVSVI
jgi:hypothetical protein